MGAEQSAQGGGAVTSPTAAAGSIAAASANTVLPKGVKRMPPELAKKFASAQHSQNLRILIRGARGVGKSSLFSRLEGGPFLDEHRSTPEVQVTHIAWNYKMVCASVTIIKMRV